MQLPSKPHSFVGGWVSGQLAVYVAARTLALSNIYSTQHPRQSVHPWRRKGVSVGILLLSRGHLLCSLHPNPLAPSASQIEQASRSKIKARVTN